MFGDECTRLGKLFVIKLHSGQFSKVFAQKQIQNSWNWIKFLLRAITVIFLWKISSLYFKHFLLHFQIFCHRNLLIFLSRDKSHGKSFPLCTLISRKFSVIWSGLPNKIWIVLHNVKYFVLGIFPGQSFWWCFPRCRCFFFVCPQKFMELILTTYSFSKFSLNNNKFSYLFDVQYHEDFIRCAFKVSFRE